MQGEAMTPNTATAAVEALPSIHNTEPYSLEYTLREAQKLDFRGNMIPHIWYHAITFENGKPDVTAILLLLKSSIGTAPKKSLMNIAEGS
jgi:hypothetical protein